MHYVTLLGSILLPVVDNIIIEIYPEICSERGREFLGSGNSPVHWNLYLWYLWWVSGLNGTKNCKYKVDAGF